MKKTDGRHARIIFVIGATQQQLNALMGINNMVLIKLSSSAGSNIYDSEHWTEEEMQEDYVDTYGVKANKKSRNSFDVLKGHELKDWIDE